MASRTCNFCGQPCPTEYQNYCSWDCHVSEARAKGGKTIAPNDLPIACVRADNALMEHEHADHPDYKFPVEVEFAGRPAGRGDIGSDLALYGRVLTDKEWVEAQTQTHALIYTDCAVAITLYEACYAMWYLYNGSCGGGTLWNKKDWKLTQASIDKIKEKIQ